MADLKSVGLSTWNFISYPMKWDCSNNYPTVGSFVTAGNSGNCNANARKTPKHSSRCSGRESVSVRVLSCPLFVTLLFSLRLFLFLLGCCGSPYELRNAQEKQRWAGSWFASYSCATFANTMIKLTMYASWHVCNTSVYVEGHNAFFRSTFSQQQSPVVVLGMDHCLASHSEGPLLRCQPDPNAHNFFIFNCWIFFTGASLKNLMSIQAFFGRFHSAVSHSRGRLFLGKEIFCVASSDMLGRQLHK